MINEEAKIFFDNFTQRHVTEYKNHFQQRLAAVYVCGSVHRGEAVPGVSDVDIHPFITDELDEADWEWYRRAEEKFDREFLGVHGLCTPDPVDHLVFFPIRHGKYTTDEDARIRAQSLVHRMRYDGTGRGRQSYKLKGVPCHLRRRMGLQAWLGWSCSSN